MYTQRESFTKQDKSLSAILNNSQQYFYITDMTCFVLTSLHSANSRISMYLS